MYPWSILKSQHPSAAHWDTPMTSQGWALRAGPKQLTKCLGTLLVFPSPNPVWLTSQTLLLGSLTQLVDLDPVLQETPPSLTAPFTLIPWLSSWLSELCAYLRWHSQPCVCAPRHGGSSPLSHRDTDPSSLRAKSILYTLLEAWLNGPSGPPRFIRIHQCQGPEDTRWKGQS